MIITDQTYKGLNHLQVRKINMHKMKNFLDEMKLYLFCDFGINRYSVSVEFL